jgi:hypothetical protein
LSLCLACIAAAAQDAAVSGIVLDGTGAVMPDVAIAIANQNTGVRRANTTNQEGRFAAGGLQPGIYKITARKEGFQTVSKIDIHLHVAQAAQVDFVLQVSTVGESVTVSERSSGLERVDATVSTVINREFIDKLPLNGRSFQSLFALTPGVVITKASFGEQGQFSVNGQRANANYFTIDGVSANIGVSAGLTLVQSASGSLPGLGATGGTNTLVSVEALEEFRVQTSSYAAEYGRMPGAQITILTRSGTNKFHGALFHFFRNDALDATDWFAKAQQLPKPAMRQNDFGGVLGGPVQRDRTFFFASYEGLRLRQPQVLSTDVPNLDQRGLLACRACRPFLNAFPLPNRPNSRLGFAPFVASFSDVSSLDAGSIRLDHRIGNRLTVFGRYNHAPSSYTARLQMLSNPTDTNVGTQTLTTGATVVLSPRLVDEVRFNWSRTTGDSFARLDNFGGAVPFDPALFFPAVVDPSNAFGGLFMNGGVNSGFYLGKNVANAQNQLNLTDTVSLTLGAHHLKFGGDWRRVATRNNPRAYDLFVYFVGSYGASFGQTTQTTIGAQQDITVYTNNLSLFAQDTWKASRRLTLTLGLRWELNPAPSGSKPLYSYVAPSDPRQIAVSDPGAPLYATRFTNFAPRLGAAYQLTSKTAIRAGFGWFYDLGSGLMAQAAAGFPYFRQRNIITGTPFPVPADTAAPIEFTLKPPIASLYGAGPGFSTPVTRQWNATVDHQLNASNALSVAYVGAAGRDLLRQNFYVYPNDAIVYAYLLSNAAFSDFHSLQAQYQRRLSHGVQVLGSYTFGKSLDNASNESYSHLMARIVDPKNDRGASDFDIRHALSVAVSANVPGKGWLLKGWGVDGVYLLRTATPVDITYSLDTGYGVYAFRPDVVAGQPLSVGDLNVGGGRRFNLDAFEIPLEYPGRQGTLGRNVLRGFGLSQVNLSLRRDFQIVPERLKIEARAEMFNALNTPSFGDPNGSIQSPQFGYSTQMMGRSLGRGGVNGGLNPLYQVGGPRSLQLALRVVF